MSKFICDHPWTHFEVNNPNGEVTMCCDNQTVLGNVNDGSIEEIWNGEEYQDMRRMMRDHGAHAICPPTCPVLNGFKTYQNLDWYDQLSDGGLAQKNARVNEQEFSDGALELESKPRWMRFAYSYLCNLDCYHCYQREDAIDKIKLPESFMEQVHEMSQYFQVVFYFGGEPLLYNRVLKMMEEMDTDPGSRCLIITNATLLTDRIKTTLEKINIGHFAISLDAATDKSFDMLRLRGAKSSWEEVLSNMAYFAEMKKRKGFTFTASMTLNALNHDEIERFCDLCISHGAEPLVLLVSNPYQTYAFQKKFLTFTDDQFDEIERQIKVSLKKVSERQFRESEKALESLGRAVATHRRTNNRASVFLMKKLARPVFRALPITVQNGLRRALTG